VQPPSMDSVVPTPLQGEFLHLVGALGAGIAAPLLYAALLVLPLVWWTDPRYIVPAVAAMLPPAISCASAGLAAVFSELLQGEHRLAAWSAASCCEPLRFDMSND
jgi:hypothetical protein